MEPELDLGTVRLMKLLTSSKLSSAINRQCNLVLPLLRRSSPVFDKISEMAMKFVFFYVWVLLIKIANTPLDRSAV